MTGAITTADVITIVLVALGGGGGAAAAYAGIRRARREGEQTCEDRLRAARLEAEELATELHTLKMRLARGGTE